MNAAQVGAPGTRSTYDGSETPWIGIMKPAPIPVDENNRIEKLEAYEILDTMPETLFDDITYLASVICGTSIALISLVDRDRQWFKSRVGLEAAETHRDLAFCAHAILEPESTLIVPDATEDERFWDNPLVTDGPVRFYAGAPLREGEGSAIGTLCVIDSQPKQLDEEQKKALAALSRQVMSQLQLRKTLRDLATYQERLEKYQRRLEEANEALAELQYTDAATGVGNRAAFTKQLGEEFHRAKRSGRPLSLVRLDVAPDVSRETETESLLEAVAERLLELSRTGDMVAHFDGDGFAVILPGTDREGAAVLAERYRRGIERTVESAVSVSVGVAELDSDSGSVEVLLDLADAAVEDGKRASGATGAQAS